jgi:hypothetical protein
LTAKQKIVFAGSALASLEEAKRPLEFLLCLLQKEVVELREVNVQEIVGAAAADREKLWPVPRTGEV